LKGKLIRGEGKEDKKTINSRENVLKERNLENKN